MILEFGIEHAIALIFLGVLTILDLKTFNLEEGYIPSVLTTCFMIVGFLLGPSFSITVGIFGLLIGLLLIDLNIFEGVADLKTIVACAMTLSNIQYVAIFGFFTVFAGFGIKFFLRNSMKEIPYIPAITIGYIGTLGVILL